MSIVCPSCKGRLDPDHAGKGEGGTFVHGTFVTDRYIDCPCGERIRLQCFYELDHVVAIAEDGRWTEFTRQYVPGPL